MKILLNVSSFTLIKRSFLLRSKSEELSHRAYEGQLVQHHEKDSEDAPTPRPNPEPFSTSAEVLVSLSLIQQSLSIENLKDDIIGKIPLLEELWLPLLAPSSLRRKMALICQT